MPQLRLLSSAINDLRGLAPEDFATAWGMVQHLVDHPGEGILVSPLQYAADPVLHPPCTEYTKRVRPGYRITVYFEVEGGELRVFRIVPYYVL